ncbi:MAG: hypothetical protein E7544_01750 [Ruminococcaceae bacterium]|nr:hypothetical protein [Oscillospiraceae bacterium]
MFDLKMPLTDALAVSLIGIVTVIFILAVIAGLIILVSKAIRGIEAAADKKKPVVAENVASAPSGVPMPEGMNQGELELVGTDEKTAAIIMAIVSDKSGIPLNRLSFKSIKLMEDK